MKRAAIIMIYRLLQEDPPYWHTDTNQLPHLLDGTGEQLLADLRDAVDCIWGEVSWARSLDDNDPESMRLARVAQRLEELLPKEGEDE